LGNWLLEHYWA